MDNYVLLWITVLRCVCWYDRVRNDEVLQRTGLTLLSHFLSCRRISLFGHVARLDDTLAKMTLQLHINVSLNRPPDHTWRHPPGRPRNKWLDQLRNDSTLHPTGELWRRAVDRGHGGATTRRPRPRRLRDHDDDCVHVAARTTWLLPAFESCSRSDQSWSGHVAKD